MLYIRTHFHVPNVNFPFVITTKQLNILPNRYVTLYFT